MGLRRHSRQRREGGAGTKGTAAGTKDTAQLIELQRGCPNGDCAGTEGNGERAGPALKARRPALKARR